MFEKLSKKEIDEALSELIDKMGVKEDVSFAAFKDHIIKKDKQGCTEEIARLLDLPVRITLSVASEDYRQENARRFVSNAVVQTDEDRRGKEGITAQVTVPRYLPVWGTSDLTGYEIEVLVGENCLARPDTFITIMAHELSHILLAAIRSPHKDSEFHTDLVPILLGFGEFVRRGRKISYDTINGNTTTTHTITYGYLSDEIFNQAYVHVKAFLGVVQKKKRIFNKLFRGTDAALNETVRRKEIFKDYFLKISSSRPQKMKKEHAQRIVELHGQDMDGDLQAYCSGARKKLEDASAFVQNLSRYTRKAAEELDFHTKTLADISKELDRKAEGILKDAKIMRKYIKKL
jgi:hypothetical protein